MTNTANTTSFAGLTVAMDIRTDLAYAGIYAPDHLDVFDAAPMWNEIKALFTAAAERLGVELVHTQDAPTIDDIMGRGTDEDDPRRLAWQAIHDQVSAPEIEAILARYAA